MPIGLTDFQLDLIRQAARQVPSEWRSRFLDGVIDRVLPHSAPSDEAVQAAVSAVLGRLIAPRVLL